MPGRTSSRLSKNRAISSRSGKLPGRWPARTALAPVSRREAESLVWRERSPRRCLAPIAALTTSTRGYGWSSSGMKCSTAVSRITTGSRNLSGPAAPVAEDPPGRSDQCPVTQAAADPADQHLDVAPRVSRGMCPPERVGDHVLRDQRAPASAAAAVAAAGGGRRTRATGFFRARQHAKRPSSRILVTAAPAGSTLAPGDPPVAALALVARPASCFGQAREDRENAHQSASGTGRPGAGGKRACCRRGAASNILAPSICPCPLSCRVMASSVLPSHTVKGTFPWRTRAEVQLE